MAILGAVGGWYTARIFDSHDHGLSVALTLCTALVSLALGLVLRRTHRAPVWPLLVGLAVLAAGAVNGAVLALMFAGARAFLFGGLFGGYCSLAFLIPVLLVVGSTRSFGQAQRGSLVDMVVRRAPWRMLALLVTVCGAIFAKHRFDSFVLIGASALVTVLCLWLDLGTYAKLGAVLRRLPKMRPLRADELRGAATVELGLGESLHAEMWSSAAPFREGEVPTFVVRGDGARARRALRRVLVVDLLAAMISVSVLTYQLRYFLC